MSICAYLQSSIGKKQVVAVTGLMLIGFLVGHLAGNMLIYVGPEAFNAYAKKLADLRPAFLIVEFGLAAIFVGHMILTMLIAKDNAKARGGQYEVATNMGPRKVSTRSMRFTGPIIFVYLIFHLLDYTFADHHSLASVVNSENLGLYGLVWNSFLDPLRASLYVLTMAAIGLHLYHGFQSFMQTFGLNHPKYTPLIEKTSAGLAWVIALGFSSIPIYVNLKTYLPWCAKGA